MATIPISFRPPMIRAISVHNTEKSHPSTSRKPSSGSWWSPLFGWSSDGEYIIPPAANTSTAVETAKNNNDAVGKSPEGSKLESEAWGSASRSRFGRGCFTEEKAKQLRRKTIESSTFHETMYHSAIASRLASDLSGL